MTSAGIDLCSRTAGCIGLLCALIAMRLVITGEISTTVQPEYTAVKLQIKTPEREAAATGSNDISSPQETAKPPAPAPEPPVKAETVADNSRILSAPSGSTVTETRQAKPEPAAVSVPAATRAPAEKQAAPKRSGAPEKPAPLPKSRKDAPKTTGSRAESGRKINENKSTDQGAAAPAAPEFDRQAVSRAILSELKGRLDYPRQAQKRKLQGTVMVEFELKDGIVTAYSIVQSSGHSVLDRAALRLAGSLQGFDSRIRGSLKVRVPLKYELR